MIEKRPVKIALAIARRRDALPRDHHVRYLPLAWVSLVPITAVVLHPSTKRPAWYGFLCGFTANAGGFYWIVGFTHRFGELPFVAGVPIASLLYAYQASTFVLWALILRRLHDHLPQLGIVFLSPLVYVSLELVLPFIFPWYLAITQAWVVPVIQIADITGPLGVSFLVALCNGILYEAWALRKALPKRRLIAGVAVIALALGYGQVRLAQVRRAQAEAPKFKIGIVQPNLFMRHDALGTASYALELEQKLSAQLEQQGADLILWPESAYPYLFLRDQTRDWPDGSKYRVRRGFQKPVLLDTLTASQTTRYPFNSAVLLDKDDTVLGRFDKNILIVFGEYLPFYDQMRWLKDLIPEISNFGRGTEVTTFPLTLGDRTVKLGPMICYEDIFPSFGRRLTRLRPNVFINLTNDAWFGATSEPYEHMALSVYRAVESRIFLVRAENTGVSTVIDATGKVVDIGPVVDAAEPAPQPFTMTHEIASLEPAMFYATVGESFGGACLVILLLIAWRARHVSGAPVALWAVATSAIAAYVVTALVILPLSGINGVKLATELVLHATLSPGQTDAAFAVGVRLVPAIAIACIVAGALVGVLGKGRNVKLEAALGSLAYLVVPALLFGTLEGEQAGLVAEALFGVALANLGVGLARRFGKAQRNTNE